MTQITPRTPPRLRTWGTGTAMTIDGMPALCIGGELHNSSASSRAYLDDIWDRVASSGARTVIAPVAWNEFEPVEGVFDFSLLDALIAKATQSAQRLIIMWFGAFKNATSVYAPSWVRRDRDRFPRAVLTEQPFPLPFSYDGAMPRPVLSVFSAELRECDRRAYAAMMTHLAEHDPDYTVVMVQVQNEVGLLGSARDRCDVADAAWNAAVPPAVRDAVLNDPVLSGSAAAAAFREAPTTATWPQVLADSPAVDEIFMAWGFASYIEALAEEGNRIHPVPTFANAWLGPQPGQPDPGTYPSGGPTAQMIGLWRALAPTLSFVSPDIYVRDSEPVMREYSRAGNPLFIPEARFRAGDLALAIGRHKAIGYHVFGLEDGRENNQYSQLASAMLAVEQEILEAQRDDQILGFALEAGSATYTAEILGMTITVRDAVKQYSQMLLDVGVDIPEPGPLPAETVAVARGATPADERPFGIVVAISVDELVVIGQRFMIDVVRRDCRTEIDDVRELVHGEDGWEQGRLLNGDERLLLTGVDGVTAARIRLIHHDEHAS